MVLRCTRKLLAVLGAGRAAEPAPAPDAGDWYANLLWFDRRKCLLLTHAATLFSIFEVGVRAVDLRATHRLVTELVERELRREGLPLATFGNLRSQELILAKTADRSVLGCMNDMAFLCEVAISDAGGLAHCDLGELNLALHRNINSSRGYRPPVELAAHQLERGQSTGQRNSPGAGATQLTPRLDLQPRRPPTIQHGWWLVGRETADTLGNEAMVTLAEPIGSFEPPGDYPARLRHSLRQPRDGSVSPLGLSRDSTRVSHWDVGQP